MENIEPLSQQQDVVARALAEYRDQPTLCLTTAQAARLWHVDLASAAVVLDTLARSGHLRQLGAQFYSCRSELVSAAG